MQTRLDDKKQAAILLRLYHYTCAVCLGTASAMHEIVPRSKRPDGLFDVENRVPLCAKCHDAVHERGTRNSEEELRAARNALAALHGVSEVTVSLELEMLYPSDEQVRPAID
jgi:5-methylcytosine-specific restriction endonuclease McrA